MKSGFLFMVGFVAIMAMGANGRGGSNQLRSATENFQRPEMALAAGYSPASNLDRCHSSLGGAGYQYINAALIDTTVDLLKPEALVYVPGPNGAYKLGAVAYMVPVSAWHAIHPTEWPQAMGEQFHLNSRVGMYVLHVWNWENNPSGMFEDWNPKVPCV